MAKSKALSYSEDYLGVHVVYEDAKKSRFDLDQAFSDLDELYTSRRILLEAIADREVDVTVEQRSKHPESSEAALDRASKIERQKDGELKELRARLSKTESDIDGRKFDRSIAEHDIAIATARMIELGGYFAYLVQMKDHAANAANAANEAERSSS